MNLKLSIQRICEIIGVTTIDPSVSTFLIKNISVDTRSPIISSQTLFISLQGTKARGVDFLNEFLRQGGKFIVVDQPIAGYPELTQLVVPDPLRSLQKIAAFHRSQFAYPVIGITGSNGKTIVKEWLYFLLKDSFTIIRSPKSYNSQIGVALSLLEMSEKHNLAIIEAGISLPNEMQYLEEMIRPTLGIFTGIGVAHNSGFGTKNTLEAKKYEKYILFSHTNERIEKLDSDHIAIHANESDTTYSFELKEANTVEIIGKDLVKHIQVNRQDRASVINLSLCYLTMRHLLGDFSSLELFERLPSVSMRLEVSEGKNGNILINDTYNLDEKSLEIALQFLAQSGNDKARVIIIAEQSIDPSNSVLLGLAEKLRFARVDQVIYIGKLAHDHDFKFINAVFESVDDFFSAPPEFIDTTILFTGNRASKLEKAVSYYFAKKHITQLTIDLNKIKDNLSIYRRKLASNTLILAMVKAHSYGGGIVEIAKFLAGEKIAYLGVAYADEGILLRKNDVKTPILVMNPEPASFGEMIDYELEPSIYATANLDAFISELILKGRQNYPIHLKLDTGMNRLGFRRSDLPELIDLLKTQPEVYVKSVFSHLSVADVAAETTYTQNQITLFEETTTFIQDEIGYPFLKHLANSSGALNFPNTHFDMVRLGIGLFGLLNREEFQPALTFTSEISQIRKIKKGESVGYGRAFIATEDCYIAVVPVGYADGLRRSLGNGRWSFIIRGNKYPIIGNVCMDMCMLNLGLDECLAGDTVQIFGEGNAIDEMSAELKTIPYEIISSISARVKRVYLQ